MAPHDPPFDEEEHSPNSLARCKKCLQNIQKGEERVGIQEFSFIDHKWGPYYYHRTCCTPQVISNLHLQTTRTPVNRERGDPNPMITPEEMARLQRRRLMLEERRRLFLLRQKHFEDAAVHTNASTIAPPPPYDNVEHSPNSLAWCKKCMQHIQKGEERVGIQVFSFAYHKCLRSYYYHRTCCPPQVISNLHLPPTRGTPVNRERGDPNPIAPEERARLQRTRLIFESRFLLRCRQLDNNINKQESTMAPHTPYDKEEHSPNSLAWCKKCMQHIQKGEERVGIQEFSFIDHKWGPYYYHRTCCTPQVLSNLHLAPRRSVFEERVRFRLRQKLQRLRSPLFSRRTLDSIVENMPKTRQGLLACYGIGPKTLASSGEELLSVIGHYRTDH